MKEKLNKKVQKAKIGWKKSIFPIFRKIDLIDFFDSIPSPSEKAMKIDSSSYKAMDNVQNLILNHRMRKKRYKNLKLDFFR